MKRVHSQPALSLELPSFASCDFHSRGRVAQLVGSVLTAKLSHPKMYDRVQVWSRSGRKPQQLEKSSDKIAMFLGEVRHADPFPPPWDFLQPPNGPTVYPLVGTSRPAL